MVIRQFRFKNYWSTLTREPPIDQQLMRTSILSQELETNSSIQKLLHVKRQSTTNSQMTS